MNLRHNLISALLTLWPISAWPALPQADAVPGGIAILAVAPASEPAPSVSFLGRRIITVRDGENWKAVVGLPLSLKAGEQQLAVTHNGHTRQLPFQVRHKAYEVQSLTIANKRLVNPAAADMPRINREKELMTQAFATWSPLPPETLQFDAPATGPFSARFGLRRIYNNEPRGQHTGLDVAAPEGTPIRAPADGTVIETGDFFFTGNVVFLDHGQGLVSMYIHMSRIDVVKGQAVKRGELLGAVGKTGRTTGPHLHWAVSLNNTLVDPILFLTPAARAAGEKPLAAANGNHDKPKPAQERAR